MGGANIQIVHYFDHVYLEEEKSMIYSFTYTFGAKYLTGMITSVPPYETFSFIQNTILHQSKIDRNHFENSNFWGMWLLGHVGHTDPGSFNFTNISYRLHFSFVSLRGSFVRSFFVFRSFAFRACNLFVRFVYRSPG